MEIKRTLGLSLLAFVIMQLSSNAQTLNPNFDILKPLLDKSWVGELKAPDGKATYSTTHEFKLLWDGSAVKYVGSIPELNSYSEGFFYWDREEGKIAVFIMNSEGVYQQGYVTLEEGNITVKGRIYFPDKNFEYRNTLELTKDGRMIDRWFQNAFGPWMAGHVIEFQAGDSGN
jgi:hypothetical protein